MNKIPRSCIYFPTTTLMLDDDNHFLESIVLSLRGKILTKISSDVDEALRFIMQNQKLYLAEEKLFNTAEQECENDNGLLNINIDININRIFRELYNPYRFSHISNLLLDYHMPKLNGIEFCKMIMKNSIIKTMLTGEADLITAVSAFNAGLINKFFQKSSANIMEIIDKTLHESQILYFEKLSSPLFEALADTSAGILKSDYFWEFMTKICHEHNIVEYYIIDKNGSFLLLNEDANPLWLIIRNENDFNELIDIAIGNKAPHKILFDMRRRQQIPIMISEMDQALSVEHWDKITHVVQPFAHIDKIHYALIKDINLGGIQLSQVKSFNEYNQSNRVSTR